MYGSAMRPSSPDHEGWLSTSSGTSVVTLPFVCGMNQPRLVDMTRSLVQVVVAKLRIRSQANRTIMENGLSTS